MQTFYYKAIGRSGDVHDGHVDSKDRESAIQSIRDRGLVPIVTQIEKRGRTKRGNLTPSLLSRELSQQDLLHFTRSLSTLLKSGLRLDKSLHALSKMNGNRVTQNLTESIYSEISVGSAFSDTLGRRQKAFPRYYVGLIRAGEASGSLVATLDQLEVLLQRSDAIRTEVRNSLTYPTIVLGLTCLSLVVLLLYVVPEFKPLLEGGQNTSSLASRAIVSASDLLVNWGWLILSLFLLILLLLKKAIRRSGSSHRRMDAFLISLPYIGDAVVKFEISKLCRTLGTLLRGGVSVIEALNISLETLSNTAIRTSLQPLSDQVARGRCIADYLIQIHPFPPMALEMIKLGEDSGTLESTLLQIAEALEWEVRRLLQHILALMAPMLTVGVGALVALVVGAMISAILDSYQAAL